MEIWYGAEQVPAALRDPSGPGSIVTVGVFDGVHRGHQAILARVVERAHHAATPDGRRPCTIALTFDPHPVAVHRPATRLPLITSLADRLESLAATGLDAVLVVHYTLDFADQGPEEFVRDWLEGLLGARAIVVGDDVRFGRDNSGDAATLRRIGRADGVEVEIVSDVVAPTGRRWSSTWVRELLEAGDMRGAAEVLGHVHRLRGTVIHGHRRGRELGFPTANLDAATAGVVPPDGVYAGWLVRSPQAGVAGAAGEERLPAAISIGTNPTFDDVPDRTVEAHVLGRADLNLYGEVVVIELVERLRPMLAFDGLEPLLAQMRQDVIDTAAVLDVPVPEPIRPEDVTAL
ncbi:MULTISPECIES: bifunctional riboflavin kinase/FAD synthetase [Actinomyces]|uniref:Riboflavin biosynthesis protein n=1 Tax=Actinomyces glycerinitolerans TaxID=1892869 RepID=A0A1M4S2R9_9ACTO|nr:MULTISPECIES: bifunctional riboflavin kinase/FAD synthetase [Actinomyces]RAX19295.1 bifunctional riboflavin kinase/FAD synthetase [Actinomyces sp. Z5]RAX23975.1 bifunctional riboflavin kinase/FAD synthetase [Actinomyces sp. Z3]SHE26440.1 riboflavin kinase [Actinomyces glycerinitolerans]